MSHEVKNDNADRFIENKADVKNSSNEMLLSNSIKTTKNYNLSSNKFEKSKINNKLFGYPLNLYHYNKIKSIKQNRSINQIYRYFKNHKDYQTKLSISKLEFQSFKKYYIIKSQFNHIIPNYILNKCIN